jgi:hypothetical protein
MISYETSKKILNRGNEEYTDEEVVLITNFVWKLAKINAKLIIELTKSKVYEESCNNGSCKQ